MIILKWVIIGLTIAFFIVVGITWFALERSDVVEVVTTRHDENRQRSTNAWFVEDANQLLLEAGRPDNPWVLDIDQNSTLELVRSISSDDDSPRPRERYCTRKDDSPSAHTRIRKLMRAKYGWRDAWIDMLFDVERSALVELRSC